ncbi:hypothetical protein [Shimia sp.]|uniref:hypothetical protein n=1 Tax=Shimia sp. TaxID=1954381 RepID=UPI003270B3FE
MMAVQTYLAARGRAVLDKGRAAVDVILHVGAHRTGLTSFCAYLAGQRAHLRAHDTEVWTPRDTRHGLMDGLFLASGRSGVARRRARGAGRVALRVAGLQRREVSDLLVIEPNMLGSLGDNVRRQRLYPATGERMARMSHAFGGQVRRVILTVRSLEDFWTSSLSWAVPQGARVPNAGALDRLVTQPRSWRDVITDLACAVPGADILVAPYERLGGRNHDIVEYAVAGRFSMPRNGEEIVLKEAPALGELRQVLRDRGQTDLGLPDGWGRWRPFDAVQSATLREIYADDMHWLRAGADGLAFLIEEAAFDQTGNTPLAGA